MFDTELIKMNVSAERGEKAFKDALKLFNGKCPEKNDDCKWCKLIEVEK